MTFEHVAQIRRCGNGSIDNAYYLERGRIARSRQAYVLIARLKRQVRRMTGLWPRTHEDTVTPAAPVSAQPAQGRVTETSAQSAAALRKAA